MKGILSSLLFFILFSCSVKRVSSYEGVNYPVSDTGFVTADLDSIISPYKLEMESKMDKIIGHSTYDLIKYEPESPLGNFVADVVFNEVFSNADSSVLTGQNTMCLLNFGGLRAPISKGDITIGNIYELMPFDNEIVIVKLTGTQVKEMLSYIHERNGQPISNALVEFSNDHNYVRVGGSTYSYDNDLYVITSDYLAKGGDKMTFFKESKFVQTGVLIRDALLDYVIENDTIPFYSKMNRVNFLKTDG
jgi:2',3'-cyclic-nucleotide 2'-phosphodiesterase (5'-nucleotidase family)